MHQKSIRNGGLKVLEKEGIPIDLIVSKSMGGLIGGIYYLGYTTSELMDKPTFSANFVYWF